MKQVKASDLRSKSDDQMVERLAELRKEQFNLRIQKATGQLAKVSRVAEVRREIAQIETLRAETRNKQKGAA